MEFEYDPAKSAANKLKHGLDFEKGKALWEDRALLFSPATFLQGEPRFIVIGRIGNRVWSAICLERGQRTRIISTRRARAKEVDRYENQ